MWLRIASSASLVGGTGLFVYHLFSVIIGGGSDEGVERSTWAFHMSYTPGARLGLAIGAAQVPSVGAGARPNIANCSQRRIRALPGGL